MADQPQDGSLVQRNVGTSRPCEFRCLGPRDPWTPSGSGEETKGEMEIIAAVTKIAGAKAVMRNDSVAQVDPAGLIKRLCERWFYCGWAREAKRRMTRFTADQVQL